MLLIPSRPSFRSRIVLSIGGAVAIAGITHAQEVVINQDNPGQVSYWTPILSELYVASDGHKVVLDTPPPRLEDSNMTTPPHFALNATPLDRAPTIDTDWFVLERNRALGQTAGAYLVHLEQGQPRIWLHRNWDEGKMIGYRQGVRLSLFYKVDVPRERFPIEGDPTGPVRRRLIRESVRIVAGEVEAHMLNGVKANGMRGTVNGNPIASSAVGLTSLADMDRGRDQHVIQIIPRASTSERTGEDLFDDVVQVKIRLVVEAGPKLGLEEPERQTIEAELRFAVGKDYFNYQTVENERGRY